MSDDDRPEDDPALAEAERRRTTAQGAAGDLARMGIDPRSLGLDGPAAPRTSAPAPTPAVDEPPSGHVVPLRPEFAHARPPEVPPPPPAPPEGRTDAPVPRPTTAAEALLARTESAKPAPRSLGRLLRAVTLGLVTPDAAEASGHERDLVAAVRHRQTERRVVAFCSGKGGVGTTTVLCGVGAAFSALRDDRSVLVDLQPGTPSLARQLGLDRSIGAAALVGPGADERTVPESAGGLGVVDGVGWERTLDRRDVVGLLDRLGADYAFHLVDVGNDPGEAAHATLARSDRTVVVVGTGTAGTAALDVAMTRLSQINPAAVRSAVVVVVCQHPDGYRTAHREISRQLGSLPARVVVVPSDPTLRDGGPFDPARVSSATREAMLEVGAAIALPEDRS